MTQMMDQTQKPTEIKSPCIQVCKIVNGYCVGCRRTGKEITHWIRYTHEERENIMQQLHERLYLI